MTASSEGTRDRPASWRLLQAALAVALWIAAGSIFRLDPNSYLLVGVPITAAFQLWVRRRPLHDLWVRDGVEFRLDRRDVLVAAVLAATPAYLLVRHLARTTTGVDWVRSAWLVTAVAGAVAAAFAFRRFSRATLDQLLRCVAVTGAIGIALDVGARLARDAPPPLGAAALVDGVRWFLLYLPVAFVLEEVFFRGALDAHVHRRGEPRGLATAAFVAALWGIWHVPIAGSGTGVTRETAWAAAPVLVVIHLAFGIPLAIYWRRTGNLAVPATAHAFINAVRNVVLPPGAS